MARVFELGTRHVKEIATSLIDNVNFHIDDGETVGASPELFELFEACRDSPFRQLAPGKASTCLST